MHTLFPQQERESSMDNAGCKAAVSTWSSIQQDVGRIYSVCCKLLTVTEYR